MDNHNEKNTEWIIAGNPDKYDVVGAFRELGTIDWTQSANINVGDIVYIYVSNTVRAVRFKCKVNAVDKVTPTIDDSKYNISGEFDGTKGRYMELEMLEEFSTELFGKEALEQHGFKSPIGPMRVSVEVKEYLDIVQQLLHVEEMNPDLHDATYELIREVVKAYKKLGDLSQCDYRDLNLVYLMCVGTWKQGLDAKKKTVRESHLTDNEKKRLADLLDVLWIRAQNGKYTNSEGDGTNFGMFGTGFYTFQGKTDDKSPRDFIQMCIDIIDMNDDDAIFDRCEKTLNDGFHGMRAASASMILHGLKPMTFPIFNSNMGNDNIYVYFNTGIRRKTEIYEYINNVRIVKAFRDRNFNVKNYRIFDMAAWNIGKAITTSRERGAFQEMKEANKEFDKNLILYGPPGTGKTYNSATYAVAICDGKSVDELTDYDTVMARYNELKKTGRIAFTTFHQSYGYEEFIEGIKPVVDDSKQDVGYTIESGIFKQFCEDAKSAGHKTGDASIDAGARIWKLTIMNGDLNQVKQECFEENNVRMGFGMEEDDARSFVEDVRIGDIILSFKTRRTIDGIAIVTDDASELKDKSEYKTARPVKWLAKNIDEDITGINNGKLLHRMTFAKVPNMKVKDIIDLAERVNPGLVNTVIEENTQPYVFIIDEINRGNISKIFGELITLIENTKRAGMKEAASAILPYSGEEFSIPSNVYILGTMNTADRSIALMDTALRRRFQFIEMMPDSDVLRKIHADKVEDLDVAAMLDKINERITFLYDREHTIGHAFFTALRDDASLTKLQSIFEKSVIPLLQEYFYEDYQKIQLVLGDNAKSDDNLKFIRDEKVVAKNIFKGNVEDVIDLPEKRYSINKVAFDNINSYKEIF